MRKRLFVLILSFFLALTTYGQASFFDPTFGMGGKNILSGYGQILAIALQPDDKIVAVGNIGGAHVARFNPGGTPDSSFGTNGFYTALTSISLRDVLLQPDGKIVAAGRASSGDDKYATIRLNSDGSPDLSFGTSGVVTIDIGPGTENGYGVALQADGKLVIAGSCSPSNIGVARLKENGIVDSSFGTNGIEKSIYCSGVAKVGVTTDGKIVVGGTAPSTHGYNLMLVRYLSDGSLDPSFNSTGIVYTLAGDAGSNYGRGMKLQPDDKILLAGSASYGSEGSNFVIVRYNTDGTLDASFGSGGITSVDFDNNDDGGGGIAIAPDGKIILCGSSIEGDKSRVAMACLENNGLLNTTWGNSGKIVSTWGDVYDGASDIVLQPDSKVLLSGVSSSDNVGNHNPVLARYTSYPNSIENTQAQRSDLFYPNPAKDRLFVSDIAANISSIFVTNTTGERFRLHMADNTSIDVTQWPTGLYLFSIIKNDGTCLSERVFVEE
ncbi:MAG: T9SS type A sorting domain-containing protein [Taibaiella sp.]|nr:T9SS type A sorting domain-containing protein [Taibaiella sp.]